ncbi:MAG: HAD family hydrolase [Candidatus Neomarinimicrobiota bacterium]|nr:HAD family hydrolase [Candidatus Neomarinimicrobiota bacterium]
MNKIIITDDWEPEAYLFDFEGTLVTFEWNITKGISEILNEIELIGYSMNLFEGSPSYVDIHKVASVISEHDDESTIMNVIAEVFDQFDADALSRWKLYKDAKQTLNKLKKNGKLLGLVSNVGSKAINSAINKHELDDIFEIVITRNHVSRLKPDPEGLLMAANSLKIDPDSILFTGDSYDDLGAAKAANMKSCYLSGGQDEINVDDGIQPDFIINRLKELII